MSSNYEKSAVSEVDKLRQSVLLYTGVPGGFIVIVATLARNQMVQFPNSIFILLLSIGAALVCISILSNRFIKYSIAGLLSLFLYGLIPLGPALTQFGLAAPALSLLPMIPAFGFFALGKRGGFFGLLVALLSFAVVYFSTRDLQITDSLLSAYFAHAQSVTLPALICSGFMVGFVYEVRRVHSETEIKKMAAKLNHLSQLASLGELAGGIAHEVNNPISIILGKSTLLKHKLEEEKFDRDYALETLKSISANSERVGKIISGLRLYSQDIQDEFVANENIYNLVEQTCSLRKQRLADAGIELRFAGSKTATARVIPGLLSQALVALINNAALAVEKLEEKWVEISVFEYVETIDISVVDSGRGIDKETADKMMMPFFTTKPVALGQGLGLSMALGVVKSHGGNLTYDSEKKNTTFIISLPKEKLA